MRAPETPANAGPRSSGPALCDTAYQSPTSAAGALQSAREGRGLAFRGWRLLGRPGRTGVQGGLSVSRGPDVDTFSLEAGSVWGKAGDGRRVTGAGEPAPQWRALAGALLRFFGDRRVFGICQLLMAFPELRTLKRTSRLVTPLFFFFVLHVLLTFLTQLCHL